MKTLTDEWRNKEACAISPQIMFINNKKLGTKSKTLTELYYTVHLKMSTTVLHQPISLATCTAMPAPPAHKHTSLTQKE